MSAYHVMGLPDDLANAVRDTMLSPGYGHPVLREVAKGTGPCRACLTPFRVGEEERLLFTYRPDGGTGTLEAPGPVFIHATSCTRFRGPGFPEALLSFELILEAKASNHRVPEAQRATGAQIDPILNRLLDMPDVEYVNVRHGEAGCFIARVHRGPVPASSA
jgi:hypothetical protein